jgi:uncharacterized membrane protein YoaK (UPF0700 family)
MAICAGIVNVVAFYSLGTFVSHVTGTTSKAGMRLGGGVAGDWETPLLLLASFLIGATLCGFAVAHNEVHFGKSLYGAVLLGNAALLILATQLAQTSIAPYLLACACGLQNGMCTMHFGAVVRTTHVTGLVTDLGLSLGRILAVFSRFRCKKLQPDGVERAQVSVDTLKLRLLLCLGLGFFSGAALGGQLAASMGIKALWVPAAVTGTGGLLCAFFRNHIKASLKSIELATLSDHICELQDLVRSYYRTAADTKSPTPPPRCVDEAGGEASQADDPDNLDKLMDRVDADVGRLQRCLTKMLEAQELRSSSKVSGTEIAQE